MSIQKLVPTTKNIYREEKVLSTEIWKMVQVPKIDGPIKPIKGYELIAPTDAIAIASKDGNSIDVSATVYINSSHEIAPLSIYENIDYSQIPDGNMDIYIVFHKESYDPSAKFHAYKIDFTICQMNREIDTLTLFLKSSNPRASRGTVTTVKSPAKS